MLLFLLQIACFNKPHPPTQLPPPMPGTAPAAAQATPTAPEPSRGPVGNTTPFTAPDPQAQRTDSGLAYLSLSPRSGGISPDANDRVTVHYSGWLADGTLVDSSVNRGSPATFPLSAVIPGWTEGLQYMSVGERALIWIPEELGYQGRPGMPNGLTLWDVELISVEQVD